MLTLEEHRTHSDLRREQTDRLLAWSRRCSDSERQQIENDIVRVNLGVALTIARRYRGRGIADEDLDQVASLGLVKAARAFDPEVGTDFLAFAGPTIRGEVRRHFRDAGWTVRPSRPVQELQPRVVAAEAELAQRLGRSPRPSEIATHLETDLTLVTEALAANGLFHPESLEQRTESSDAAAALGATVPPEFELAEGRLAVRPLIVSLSERERKILELRFFQDRTQSQIGEELGVSQEQVSRLITQILGRLRRRLTSDAA